MAFVNAFERAFPSAQRCVGLQANKIRRGEDAGFSRRSLRLLCGDWLPPDDGPSEGCLAVATDVGICLSNLKWRNPSTASASSLLRIVRCVRLRRRVGRAGRSTK